MMIKILIYVQLCEAVIYSFTVFGCSSKSLLCESTGSPDYPGLKGRKTVVVIYLFIYLFM